MPCNTSHMEPTVKERQRKEAAKLLVFLKESLGEEVSPQLNRDASHIYGGKDDSNIVDLCSKLKSLTDEQLGRVVYNGWNKQSRKLADWWDEHQEEDRKRKSIEEANMFKSVRVERYAP